MRDVLNSIPCRVAPTIFLPAIHTNIILRLRAVFDSGISAGFWDVEESGGLLDAATAFEICLEGSGNFPDLGGLLLHIEINHVSQQA